MLICFGNKTDGYEKLAFAGLQSMID